MTAQTAKTTKATRGPKAALAAQDHASAHAHLPDSYRAEHQKEVTDRLKRIEGQVRALIQMVDSGRPCEDVAQQMSAARKAMDKVFFRMMACSLMESVQKGDEDPATSVAQSTKILERYA